MSFSLFLVRFIEKKGTKSSKILASYRGPMLRRRDPLSGEGPRQGVDEMRIFPSSGSSQRSSSSASPWRSYCS